MLQLTKAAHNGLLILSAVILFSCNSSKKYQRQVDRVILTHPDIAAAELRKAFPCITTPISNIVDSAGYKQWKDSVDALNKFYGELLSNIEPTTIVDTVVVPDSVKVIQLLSNINGFKKLVATKDAQIKKLSIAISNVPTIHDTTKLFVEDKANDAIIKGQAQTIDDYKTKLAEAKGKWDMWKWIAIGLMAVIGVWAVFKIMKLFGL